MSDVADEFERIAQNAYSEICFAIGVVTHLFSKGEIIKETLKKVGLEDHVDTLGGIDVASMNLQQIGKLIGALAPTPAKISAATILVAEHFKISEKLAKEVVVARVTGKIKGTEQAALEFIKSKQVLA